MIFMPRADQERLIWPVATLCQRASVLGGRVIASLILASPIAESDVSDLLQPHAALITLSKDLLIAIFGIAIGIPLVAVKQRPAMRAISNWMGAKRSDEKRFPQGSPIVTNVEVRVFLMSLGIGSLFSGS
jgi:hypothetical protein